MKHFKIVFILFLAFWQLNGKTFKEYETEITKVRNDLGYLKNSNDIYIGSSGIVVRKINSEISVIVAKAVVISKQDGQAVVKLTPFEALKHERLPSLKLKTEIGDRVILNYFYDKALIIVPNLETFEDVISKHKDIDFIHPDIFIVELMKSKDEAPSYQNFKMGCQKLLTNLIYFGIEDKGYFVDCNSFKILKEEKIKNYKKIVTPFYSRIGKDEINTFSFGFGNSAIDDYNSYYRNLLKEKNDK